MITIEKAFVKTENMNIVNKPDINYFGPSKEELKAIGMPDQNISQFPE
jgi:hypothetical protein